VLQLPVQITVTVPLELVVQEFAPVLLVTIHTTAHYYHAPETAMEFQELAKSDKFATAQSVKI